MLSTLSHEENVFNVAVLEPRIRLTSSSQDYKVSQMKINLDKVSVVDKISLYKQIGEMIFFDLLQTIVNITKLKVQITQL